MPLYEYQCEDCRETVEVLQKVADVALSECAACGGELRRLVSAPGIRFKGAGWYITDYQAKNGQDSTKDSSSTKETKTTSTADSQTPSEVAPAKKKEKTNKD